MAAGKSLDWFRRNSFRLIPRLRRGPRPAHEVAGDHAIQTFPCRHLTEFNKQETDPKTPICHLDYALRTELDMTGI